MDLAAGIQIRKDDNIAAEERFAVLLERKTVTLVTKAPSNMPGATRMPNKSRTANARPEGGHTGVALVAWYCNNKL